MQKTTDRTIGLEELRGLGRHALSNAFSDASKEDFALLVDSLRQRGYDSSHPIILYEGDILDGRHRQQACIESGVEPTFMEFVGTADEAWAYAFSANMARRQMTQPQKAMVLVIRNQMLPVKEQLSDVEIAARTGKSSPRLVTDLRKVNEADPAVARDIADGKVKAEAGVRQVLKGKRTSRQSQTDNRGVFQIKRKLAKVYAVRDAHGWTDQQTINKAVDLLIEWHDAQ